MHLRSNITGTNIKFLPQLSFVVKNLPAGSTVDSVLEWTSDLGFLESLDGVYFVKQRNQTYASWCKFNVISRDARDDIVNRIGRSEELGCIELCLPEGQTSEAALEDEVLLLGMGEGHEAGDSAEKTGGLSPASATGTTSGGVFKGVGREVEEEEDERIQEDIDDDERAYALGLLPRYAGRPGGPRRHRSIFIPEGQKDDRVPGKATHTGIKTGSGIEEEEEADLGEVSGGRRPALVLDGGAGQTRKWRLSRAESTESIQRAAYMQDFAKKKIPDTDNQW